MSKILLIGGGGHCKVVINAIKLRGEHEIAGIIDLEENIGKNISGVPFIGTDSGLEKYLALGIRHCIVTAGSVGDTSLRQKLYRMSLEKGFFHVNVVHPSATLDESVAMGDGNFISAGAIINAGARIGNNCIVNTGAIIEHDCLIGDNVHIAPGAVISGGVRIGRNSHIGTGSSVIQMTSIGENVIIGAGSNVVNDVEDGAKAFGNPCRKAGERI